MLFCYLRVITSLRLPRALLTQAGFLDSKVMAVFFPLFYSAFLLEIFPGQQRNLGYSDSWHRFHFVAIRSPMGCTERLITNNGWRIADFVCLLPRNLTWRTWLPKLKERRAPLFGLAYFRLVLALGQKKLGGANAGTSVWADIATALLNWDYRKKSSIDWIAVVSVVTLLGLIGGVKRAIFPQLAMLNTLLMVIESVLVGFDSRIFRGKYLYG